MKVHYTTDINPDEDADDGLYTGLLQKDGYEFGDRLLEGVIFLVDVRDGVIDPDTVRVLSAHADYLSNLNEAKWLKAAKEAFLEEEEEYDVRDHPDAYVAWPVFEKGEKPPSRMKPVRIEVTNGTDLLKELTKD